jgi:hypothetical protein
MDSDTAEMAKPAIVVECYDSAMDTCPRIWLENGYKADYNYGREAAGKAPVDKIYYFGKKFGYLLLWRPSRWLTPSLRKRSTTSTSLLPPSSFLARPPSTL